MPGAIGRHIWDTDDPRAGTWDPSGKVCGPGKLRCDSLLEIETPGRSRQDGLLRIGSLGRSRHDDLLGPLNWQIPEQVEA